MFSVCGNVSVFIMGVEEVMCNHFEHFNRQLLMDAFTVWNGMLH